MRHHYVPRFYLKNFASDEKETLVYSMTKKGEIPNKPNAISDICQKENYNTLEQESKHAPFLNILTYAMCNRAVYGHSREVLKKVDADKRIFQDYCSNGFIPSFDDLVLSGRR